MGQVWAVLMSSGSLGNIFLLGGAFFDTQFPAIPVERASCAVFSLFSSFFFWGGGATCCNCERRLFAYTLSSWYRTGS